MKSKITFFYWLATILFALLMLMDGFAGIAHQKDGAEILAHLGYPLYAMTIFGIAKVLGAIAILQNKFKTIKEWAFAGFTINYIGAFASRYLAGDPPSEMIPPIIAIAIMFIPYILWKKTETLKIQ